MFDKARRGMLPALVALLSWACAEAPTASQTTLPPGSDGTQPGSVANEGGALAANGVVHSVSGAGHIWASPPGGGMQPALRRFTVDATLRGDGAVSGHYNLVAASGLHIEGVVTCMSVVGNRAFIGGTFRNAQPPPPFTPVGVAIEVVDGGSGPDVVDQIGPLGIFAAELGATEADVQAYCGDAIEGPVSTIDLGSITVR